MDKTAVFCTGLVVLAVLGIAAAFAFNDYFVKAKAFEQGYEQQSIPGQNGVFWVKREVK